MTAPVSPPSQGPRPSHGPRRFYEAVEVEAGEVGFHIRLDGRPVRSPKGAPLSVPTRALAERVAEEWRGQEKTLHLAGMGLTRLAHTALDLSPESAAALADEQARYAAFDLLCHRAEAPAVLAAQEASAWDPWLAWADRELGVRLEIAEGITSKDQPADSLARVRALAGALDAFALTGLGYATALFASSVLGFAALRGALDAAEAYELSRLDEAFQQSQWGEDAEAVARTAAGRRDAALIGAWFEGLRA